MQRVSRVRVCAHRSRRVPTVNGTHLNMRDLALPLLWGDRRLVAVLDPSWKRADAGDVLLCVLDLARGVGDVAFGHRCGDLGSVFLTHSLLLAPLLT